MTPSPSSKEFFHRKFIYFFESIPHLEISKIFRKILSRCSLVCPKVFVYMHVNLPFSFWMVLGLIFGINSWWRCCRRRVFFERSKMRFKRCKNMILNKCSNIHIKICQHKHNNNNQNYESKKSRLLVYWRHTYYK